MKSLTTYNYEKPRCRHHRRESACSQYHANSDKKSSSRLITPETSSAGNSAPVSAMTGPEGSQSNITASIMTLRRSLSRLQTPSQWWKTRTRPELKDKEATGVSWILWGVSSPGQPHWRRCTRISLRMWSILRVWWGRKISWWRSGIFKLRFRSVKINEKD